MDNKQVINIETKYGSLRIDTWSSPTITKLASALAKAQLEISNPKKKNDNPFFKSKYADLAECINTALPVLNSHGIAITQLQQGDKMHTFLLLGDEWLRSECPICCNGQKAQDMGSAITYARRYSFSAICCIAQEDDDANNAGKGKIHLTAKQQEDIEDEINGNAETLQLILSGYNVSGLSDISSNNFSGIIKRIKEINDKKDLKGGGNE